MKGITGDMNNDMFTKNSMGNRDDRDLSLSTKKSKFVPGAMTEGRFWLLIEISSIHSEKVITALNEHLVLGYSRREVCERNNGSAGYLSLSLAKLIRIESAVALLLAS
ncbi:adhesin biosynthesis transcription regulatory family protein [Edwardsiella tarda]